MTTKPPVTPRLSSTMLLLRQREDMEVFMMVRHDEIDFASGALVFPGGSVDPNDKTIVATPELYATGGTSDPASLALRIAAIRETFEESGILLARRAGSDAIIAADHASQVETRYRTALCEGRVTFAEMLTDTGLVLALDMLVPFAHWITPVTVPKRFDTHFFLAAAPDDQVGAHDGHESVDSIWASPRAVLQGADDGRFKVLFPTRRNITKLGLQTTVADALETARRSTIVTVLPEVLSVEGRRALKIPVEAGYGGELFFSDLSAIRK